ncbi:phosphoribosylaminoimidazole carboxylase [Streptococcus infantis]|uniref:phosphoribosylaminoimidazole carboxylase n=1 Tax=Streptococcus infantis TaxID=68892 RepID=UPI0039C2303C
MIQTIVNALDEKDKIRTSVEVMFASSNHEKVKAKHKELVTQYTEYYYDEPLDTDLNTLDYCSSAWIGKEE